MTSKRLACDQRLSAPKRRKLDEDHEGEQSSNGVTASTGLCHDDYTVGWICILPLEIAVAEAMLDEIHPSLPQSTGDDNTYILGRIGAHNIVIACMPSGMYGSISVVKVATMMMSSYVSVRFSLMVGIGGGAPSHFADIRLGDVVVSKPSELSGGVIQFDFGKSTLDGEFERRGILNKPPQALLTAISKLEAAHIMRPSRIPQYVSEMLDKYPHMSTRFTHPGPHQDRLFEAQYQHDYSEVTCERCDPSCLVARPPRAGSDPAIHYGLIASTNQLVTNGESRDRLARKAGILCFETEAAGLMADFPCLVIRGVCDYADSHRNNQWQGYSAATAAAYAKEVLSVIPGIQKVPKPTAATTTPSQLPGAENPSLTSDPGLQDAILRYNVALLVQRLQAAHSELDFDNQGVTPQPTDDRSLSVYTRHNDALLPTLFAQLAGSIYRPQRFSVPSTASHSHEFSPSSLNLAVGPARPRHRRDFRVALICALPLEADAVKAAFDKRWDDDGYIYGKAPRDQNAYSTGVIGRHNVVLAHMPGTGKETAASVAANFRSSFEGVQLALVVGVCGAVPMTQKGDAIFLGDVVISEGIITHDFGSQYPDRFARKDDLLNRLGRPNAEIRALLAKLKGRWDHRNLEAKVVKHMPALQRELGETSKYPGAGLDKLFLSSYRHKHRGLSGCDLCNAWSHKADPVCKKALDLTCEQLNCGDKESIQRDRLNEAAADDPQVHFGLVASGDVVMKSGEDRDQIAAKENVIAFEMEGAGVWDTIPCLIIKGACDYADSHKSKRWQNYAAASAAACMKAFLENWATSSTES